MTKAKAQGLPIRKYLILIFIAVLLISGSTFSKYVSTSTGSGEVRVAIFASDVEIRVPIKKLSPGESVDVPILVSNFEGSGMSARVSEVSQTYTLEALTEGVIPLVIEWDEETRNNGLKNDFHVADNPQGAGQEHTHTLSVTWPAGESDYTLADELVVVRIRVHVEQID